jgi:hypothetical protein
MTEAEIEIILERAKGLHPKGRPRIISDNGAQFIAKDFKELIQVSGMTHVRTSPYVRTNRYKESASGRVRHCRWRMRGGWWKGYVERYNDVRLNSAIGYVTPKDMLAGRKHEIHAERDRKLRGARKQRQIRRQQAA